MSHVLFICLPSPLLLFPLSLLSGNILENTSCPAACGNLVVLCIVDSSGKEKKPVLLFLFFLLNLTNGTQKTIIDFKLFMVENKSPLKSGMQWSQKLSLSVSRVSLSLFTVLCTWDGSALPSSVQSRTCSRTTQRHTT